MGYNPFRKIQQEKNKMKCFRCKKEMVYKNDLKFASYKIKGWRCDNCGEEYYDETEKLEMILLLNKLKKSNTKVKLGKIRSNLILRIPKDVEKALNLKQGEQVTLMVDENELRIIGGPGRI